MKRILSKLFKQTLPDRSLTLPEVSQPTKDETSQEISLLFPIGHFYSPIANPIDIRDREEKIWATKNTLPGINLNEDVQLSTLKNIESYVSDINYPSEQQDDPTIYFYGNDQFPVLDAEFLFCALRYFKPKVMIEVGSGFSSLIVADVNRRFFGNNLDFSCIEPYPRQFLIDGVEGITRLITKKVEDVDLEYFDQLNSGDILFIDSSHVSKVGSDVNYLFFEILPRLKKGVIVHIHDIFLPDEYPKVWVIDQGRNWNEQYLLQAFLQFNSDWDVIWASHFMGTRYHQDVTKVFHRYPSLGGGGSFWLVRSH